MSRPDHSTQLDTIKKEAQNKAKSLIDKATPRIMAALKDGDARDIVFLVSDILEEVSNTIKQASGLDPIDIIKTALASYAAISATDAMGITDVAVSGVTLPTKMISTFMLALVIKKSLDTLQKETVKQVTLQRQQKICESHSLDHFKSAVRAKVDIAKQGTLLKAIYPSLERIIKADFGDTAFSSLTMNQRKGYPIEIDGVLYVDILRVKSSITSTDENKPAFTALQKLDQLISSIKGDDRQLMRVALYALRNRYVRFINGQNDPSLKSIQQEEKTTLTMLHCAVKENDKSLRAVDSAESLAETLKEGLNEGGASSAISKTVSGIVRTAISNHEHNQHNLSQINNHGINEITEEEEEILKAPLTRPSYMDATHVKGFPINQAGLLSTAIGGLKDLMGDDGVSGSLDKVDTAVEYIQGKQQQTLKQQYDAVLQQTVKDLVSNYGKKGLFKWALAKGIQVADEYASAGIQKSAADGAKKCIDELLTRVIANLSNATFSADQEQQIYQAYVPHGYMGQHLQGVFGRGIVPQADDGSSWFFVIAKPPHYSFKNNPDASELNQTIKALSEWLDQTRNKLSNGVADENTIKLFQWKACVYSLLIHLVKELKASNGADVPLLMNRAERAIARACEEIKKLAPKDPQHSDLKTLNLANIAQIKEVLDLTEPEGDPEAAVQGGGAKELSKEDIEALGESLPLPDHVGAQHAYSAGIAQQLFHSLQRVTAEIEKLTPPPCSLVNRLLRRNSQQESSSGDEAETPETPSDREAKKQQKEKEQQDLYHKIMRMRDSFSASAKKRPLLFLPEEKDERYSIQPLSNNSPLVKGFSLSAGLSSAVIASTATAIPLVCVLAASAISIAIPMLAIVAAAAIGVLITSIIKKSFNKDQNTDEAKAKYRHINNLLGYIAKQKDTEQQVELSDLDNDTLSTVDVSSLRSESESTPAADVIAKIFKKRTSHNKLKVSLEENPYAQVAYNVSVHRHIVHGKYTSSSISLASKIKKDLMSTEDSSEAIKSKKIAKDMIYSLVRIVLANDTDADSCSVISKATNSLKTTLEPEQTIEDVKDLEHATARAAAQNTDRYTNDDLCALFSRVHDIWAETRESSITQSTYVANAHYTLFKKQEEPQGGRAPAATDL